MTTTQSSSDPLGWLEEEQRSMARSRVVFQQQLASCDEQLVEVGGIVAGAIPQVTEAFLEADAHRAGELIATLAIDRRCVRLEDACYLLLARQAPVAGDLRRLVAILRSVGDVERSAHLLRHIAESLTWVHPPSMVEELRKTIGDLGKISQEIFRGAVDAWAAHDPLAANELNARDDQVDFLQKALLAELYTGPGGSVEEAVSLALIARYYERVADHGVEIARQVAYYLTGQRAGDE
jgi:phosphate transport system protein